MTDKSIKDIAAVVIEKYGWFVFPIKITHNEKKCDGGNASCKDVQPLVTHWRVDSTNDLAVLETLPWSKANAYGIDCGRSGIIVVDEDPGANWDGPETLTLQTGRGFHYIYEDVLGLKASLASVEPWGVDVKGVGGFIIGPGSKHPHGEYRKVKGSPAEITLAPGQLTARLVVAAADEPAEDGEETGEPKPTLSATEARSRLEGVYKRMAAAQEGERNNVLNLMAATAAGILTRVEEDDQVGELREARIKKKLTTAALDSGLDEGEVAGTIASGWSYGWKHPVTDQGPAGVIEKIFITPTLQHVKLAAQAQMLAPLAVLAAVLARVLVEIPPNYVIPPTVGSRMSLNLAFGLVGRSGQGKSACLAVADELLGFDQSNFEQGLGSPEGLIETYYEGAGNARTVVAKPTQLLEIDEIDRLNTLDKKGTGIGAIIRTAVTGGNLKTGNATQDRRRSIPKHRYRFVLVAGIQPELADYLLNDSDAGTPQRFLWVPVWVHPDEIPDEEPAYPGSLDLDFTTIEGVALGSDGIWNLDLAETIEIEQPDWLKKEIRDTYREQLKEEEDQQESLSAHKNLTRLRVATALAMLHGEIKLSEQWWGVAGELMKISDKTQKKCFAAIARSAEAKTIARYRLQGKGEYAKQEAFTEQVEKVSEEASDKIAELLEEGGEMTVRELKAKLAKRLRLACDATLVEMESAGKVTIEEVKPKTGRPKKVVRLVKS